MKHIKLIALSIHSFICFSQSKLEFEKMSPMPNEADAFASDAFHQDLYAITGGDDFQKYKSQLQVYNIQLDSWLDIPIEGLPIINFASAIYGGLSRSFNSRGYPVLWF